MTTGAPLQPPELAEQVSALGVRPGGDLMVHASLRRLGPVAGGATGVIEAVRLAIRPDGTMVMMVAADDDVPFDRLTSPADADNGVLADVFRRHTGVEVNDHPACRLAAWGPASAALLAPQPLHDYYGPGSPLERLSERRAQVLRLGSDLDTVTLTHYAEYLTAVPDKRVVTRRYTRADSGAVDVHSLDDSAGIVDWPHGDYFAQILIDYLAVGRANVGAVGDCTAELLDAQDYLEYATRWMDENLAES